ncbi:MAG: NAD(P)/FAD-dependent oxidoreductase [Leucothrix sp.]
MSKRVCVLGAGSVGVSTALHLQLKGWNVTLVDAKPPASETSYGNAGVISSGSMVPLNNPDMLKSLPAYMSNLHPAVRYNMSYCMRHLSWLKDFFAQAKEQPAMRNADDLNLLISAAGDAHKQLMGLAGNASRYTETGWLKVYREERSNQELSFEHRALANHGAEVAMLTIAELRDLEPSLSPIFASGMWIKGDGFINNPPALIREYADYFVSIGGQFKQQKIRSIDPQTNGFRVQLDQQVIEADSVVIALGPWSQEILKPLGYQLPLGAERGYHLHFSLAEGNTLYHSVHDVDGAYVMTPMEQGLRVTCGVELNDRDAASNYSQLDALRPKVSEAIGVNGETEAAPWRGTRPSFPDGKPVIGPAPKHNNLWFAFGHGHIGLNTGPITGKLLAQQMTEQTTDINIDGFSAERFDD